MRRAVVVAVALVAAACGPHLVKLPAGRGVPVPGEGLSPAYVDATKHCESVHTLTAVVSVNGTAAGRRVRGRLLTGLAEPASVRLEAVTPFGPPLFIFVATGDDATLLLPQDGRVLEHGRPDAVLDAVAGVPFSPADLKALLTGCASASGRGETSRLDDLWQLVSMAGDDLYLHRVSSSAPWELVASIRRTGDRGEWRADFRDRRDGLPQAVHVTSVRTSAGGAAFDLDLALSDVDVNMPLGPDAFGVQTPATARPITLDELRRSGPLGSTKADGR